MKTLNAIVDNYKLNHQRESERELKWFEIQKNLKDAICKAALAQKPSGKRFDHQRRLQESALQRSCRILLESIDEIEEAKSFDDLYEIINKLLSKVKGVGELYIYDTALRIGAKLGLEPDKVYLHRGTREGARRLGLDITKRRLEVSEVPEALRKLKPREIEDVLCIYKDQF